MVTTPCPVFNRVPKAMWSKTADFKNNSRFPWQRFVSHIRLYVLNFLKVLQRQLLVTKLVDLPQRCSLFWRREMIHGLFGYLEMNLALKSGLTAENMITQRGLFLPYLLVGRGPSELLPTCGLLSTDVGFVPGYSLLLL